MTAASAFLEKWFEKLRNGRRSGVYYFSLWVLPLAIALFTAVAFLGFPSVYPVATGEPLLFRSLPLEAGHTTPLHAAAALQTLPQKPRAELHDGAWLLIELPKQARAQPMAIDFPSRGAEAITCWRRDTMGLLGALEGRSTTGAMRTSRLGQTLMLGQNETDAGASFPEMICEVRYSAPTTFTAALWSIPDLRAASDRFHRSVALLDGGIMTLVLFLTIIALRNQEWTFLLLAVWLVGNFRLGTYALGWDGQWLGYALSPDWQPLLRKFILAAHYLVSHTLFTQLFRNRDEHHTWPLKILQWLGVLQLAAAFVLPWGSFKVLSALVWGSALAGCVFLLLRRAARHPERLLSWRSLSLAMALAVIITVLVLTLVGQQELLDSFVSVLALLLSNVMVALVVGGVIREWKNERIRAQTDLVTGYAVTPLGLFTLDGNDHFVQMNSALRDMLGQKSDASATLNWGDFFDAQSWAQVAEATLAGKEIEIHLLSGTQPRHFALRAALVDDHVEGSLQDITARSHAMDELRDQADSDPLTHTLNRRGIEKELNQALEKLQSSQAPCSLAYMNLDHFKRINGLFGHTAGDEILKQVTGRLREVLTSDQPLGRIGSDEFVILFPNMDAAQAQFVAERVIGGLNSTSYQVGHRYFQVRSAIGVVEVDPSMDAAAAISAATRACRDARRLHQDVVVYELDSSELHAHTEELRLFDQLEGGASPKGLYLEMQPIMALENPAESLNFEILLRVRDSEGGLISTGKIVSAAEESGIITIIDKWVFSATLEWLAKHEDRLRRTRFVNVNLSGVSLNDDKFIESLFQVLARHPQLARRLCVEITEGVALQNFERTRKLIARLQSMGVRIALDDFGAGYTSFSYLSQLGADAIKIDGALVRDMLANETNIAIVRTIVELAQNLRMISIAEWVEDIPTLEALRDMGVDYIQGYVVSAALTPMQILDAESVPELITNPDTLSYIRRNYPL